MFRRILAIAFALFILCALMSCYDYMDWGYSRTGHVEGLREWLLTSVEPLSASVAYISDSLAIRINNVLQTGIPGQNSWQPITPATLPVHSFTVNSNSHLIYFCSGGDLYRCTYSGSQITNLTPDTIRTYMKPTLSAEGRYVTMLSQSNVIYEGKLNLFDLETGELVHLEQPGNASWAVYNPELDKFFYSNPYGTLYSIKPDSTDLVTHFAGFSVEANTSRTMDNRFIAIWKASKDELNTCFVYDCLTGSSFSLDNTGFIALNPVKPELTYVRFDGEKAKLIRRHLETGDEIMIHDAHNKGGGYISGYSSFNYRMDGEKLRFVVYIMTKAAVGPYD